MFYTVQKSGAKLRFFSQMTNLFLKKILHYTLYNIPPCFPSSLSRADSLPCEHKGDYGLLNINR